MKKGFTETTLLILAVVIGLIIFLLILPAPKAKAWTVVVGPVVPSYQDCIDTCLAYYGYNTDAYGFCQSQCAYNPTVVVGPVWVGGVWYPRGYHGGWHHDHPHFDPRPNIPHDGPHHDGRR